MAKDNSKIIETKPIVISHWYEIDGNNSMCFSRTNKVWQKGHSFEFLSLHEKVLSRDFVQNKFNVLYIEVRILCRSLEQSNQDKISLSSFCSVTSSIDTVFDERERRKMQYVWM